MNLIESIEEAIVGGAKGLFDYGSLREDLHVTLRVVGEFYDFLVKSGSSPSLHEIDYMIGTIRSGMDELFSLTYGCRGIGGYKWIKSIDPKVNSDFPALQNAFIYEFEHLVQSDMSVLDRFECLFTLANLELVFLAQYFPLAILRHEAAGSKQAPESNSDFSAMMSDIREMQAGSLDNVDAATRFQLRRTKRNRRST